MGGRYVGAGSTVSVSEGVDVKLGSGEGLSPGGREVGSGVLVRVGGVGLGFCSEPGPGICASKRATPTPLATTAGAAACRAGERGSGTTTRGVDIVGGGVFPPDRM